MSEYIKRRDRIILTSIDILSDLGFQGFSTKEICRREGISDGALYKHFKSKNEIILAVLDYYSKYDLVLKETIEINKFSAKESIIFFIRMLAEYYENYPSITAVSTLYETLSHEKDIEGTVKEVFKNRLSIIKHYVDKGIENNEFKSNLDSENLTYIILGSFGSIMLKWRMDKFNFPLKQKVMDTLNMIIDLY